jgi:hypothetical protein
MPALPNPFDSGASVALTLDEAVASQSSQAPDAAADLSHSGATDCSPGEAAAALRQDVEAAADIAEPTSSTGGSQESPAPLQELVGAGDLDLIGEIFRGARKLNLPRFKLDEERFMADIEPPPLFLQVG